MYRIVLGCAAMALAVLAPQAAGAQQTTPDQPAPTTSVPPPLPPMPSSHHRWIGATERHTTSSRHRQTSTRHAAAREHRTSHDRHAAKDRHATHDRRSSHDRRSAHDRRSKHEEHQAVHASKQTIRKCHNMTYKQIMRSSSCRALIRQDIEGAEKPRHRASHDRHSSKRDRRAHETKHNATTKHHSSSHRRGSTEGYAMSKSSLTSAITAASPGLATVNPTAP